MTSFQAYALFAHAADRYETTRTNPVTGARWVPGLDSFDKQLEDAHCALLAREAFAIEGPPDCQPLPLSTCEMEALKSGFSKKYIVALYARSRNSSGFARLDHPPFEIYAAGVLALPGIGATILEHHPDLALRWPPRLLPGLDGLGYYQARRRRERRPPN